LSPYLIGIKLFDPHSYRIMGTPYWKRINGLVKSREGKLVLIHPTDEVKTHRTHATFE